MDHSFLDHVEVQKGRWRDIAAEVKAVSTRYYWLGRGWDALEIAYGTADSKPNATTVRGVWKQRHGREGAPLLVVVGYPQERPLRAMVCGPAGEDPPVVDLDHAHEWSRSRPGSLPSSGPTTGPTGCPAGCRGRPSA